MNMLLSLRTAAATASIFSVAALGCSDSNSPTQQDKDIAALRQAVAGYHDRTAAQAAGYATVGGDPGDGHSCLHDVTGGMGVHYLNRTLVNDTVEVTKPEIVIYEPQQDGSMTFVGVEYIIPYSIPGANQPAPVLFGKSFMKNETFQLWGLHAWVGRKNPSGMFAMWKSGRLMSVRRYDGDGVASARHGGRAALKRHRSTSGKGRKPRPAVAGRAFALYTRHPRRYSRSGALHASRHRTS